MTEMEEGQVSSGGDEPRRGIRSASPRRRLWNRGLCAGCLFSVAFLVVRDLTGPHVRDVEVWFGFEVYGAWARRTAPLHWLLFAVAAYGFGRDRLWPWRLAPGYLAYVALSHLVWNGTSPNGGGAADGIAQLAGFLVMGAGFWQLDRSLKRRWDDVRL